MCPGSFKQPIISLGASADTQIFNPIISNPGWQDSTFEWVWKHAEHANTYQTDLL